MNHVSRWYALVNGVAPCVAGLQLSAYEDGSSCNTAVIALDAASHRFYLWNVCGAILHETQTN